MRLGGKTKIFGSDTVKEMTAWDVKLTSTGTINAGRMMTVVEQEEKQ